MATHFIPADDDIESHELSAECPCGPQIDNGVYDHQPLSEAGNGQ